MAKKRSSNLKKSKIYIKFPPGKLKKLQIKNSRWKKSAKNKSSKKHQKIYIINFQIRAYKAAYN